MEVTYLLDTSTCVYFFSGRYPRLTQKFMSIPTRDLGVSSIAWYELAAGVAKSAHPRSLERLRQFDREIQVFDFDMEAAEMAAMIRGGLELAGTPIGPYDTLIAGHALALDATLVTHNVREFKRVRGLKHVDWLGTPTR